MRRRADVICPAADREIYLDARVYIINGCSIPASFGTWNSSLVVPRADDIMAFDKPRREKSAPICIIHTLALRAFSYVGCGTRECLLHPERRESATHPQNVEKTCWVPKGLFVRCMRTGEQERSLLSCSEPPHKYTLRSSTSAAPCRVYFYFTSDCACGTVFLSLLCATSNVKFGFGYSSRCARRHLF